MYIKKTSLQLALLANAFFSASTGIALLIAPNILAAQLGIANPHILQIIGGGLLLFVVSLVYTVKQVPISTQQVKVIIWQDALWVLGSIIILIFQLFSLTSIGYAAVAIIALIVAGLAIWQYRSLPVG